MTREEAVKKINAIKKHLTAGNPIWDVREIEEVLSMAIKALTYKNPQKPKNTCEVALISRKDAIEVVAQQFLFEASAESPYVNDDDIDEYRKLADKLFEDIPTVDAVPVVRCTDCKHWQKVPWAKEKRCIIPRWGTARPTEGTDFCSDGERREP